jgi:hypothetical protein
MSIPYPYVTQGANPVHAYDGVTTIPNSSGACLIPGNGIPVTVAPNKIPITLASYGPTPPLGATYLVTVSVTVPASGFVYVNIHLDNGLKGTGNYTPNANYDALNAANTLQILVPNNGQYNFSVTGSQTGSDRICSFNTFKRNPGVGGMTQKTKTVDGAIDKISVQGCVAVLKDAKGAVMASGTSDEDGWYLLNYKHTGKATTFYVTVTPPGKPAQTQTVTLKANAYLQTDFTVPGP